MLLPDSVDNCADPGRNVGLEGGEVDLGSVETLRRVQVEEIDEELRVVV